MLKCVQMFAKRYINEVYFSKMCNQSRLFCPTRTVKASLEFNVFSMES